MGFFVTTLIFILVGVIASLCARLCCNRGPSANFSAYLVLGNERKEVTYDIDYYCNRMLLDDVGNSVSGADETTHCSDSERIGMI
ncbi:hypothetical protein OROHE_010642 [Orobanche hederae]